MRALYHKLIDSPEFIIYMTLSIIFCILAGDMLLFNCIIVTIAAEVAHIY